MLHSLDNSIYPNPLSSLSLPVSVSLASLVLLVSLSFSFAKCLYPLGHPPLQFFQREIQRRLLCFCTEKFVLQFRYGGVQFLCSLLLYVLKQIDLYVLCSLLCMLVFNFRFLFETVNFSLLFCLLVFDFRYLTFLSWEYDLCSTWCSSCLFCKIWHLIHYLSSSFMSLKLL